MEKSIGEILEDMRLKAGYRNLTEVSKASGVHIATLSRVRNDIQRPMPETLRKLAPVLNVTYIDLMKAAGYL